MDAGWLIDGFISALSPSNLFIALIGCLLGTLVGVLPGLGPASAIALLIPFTAYLSPAGAVIGLGSIFYGAMYGGSTTSVLLNIPGEVASVPAALEGYQLCKKGRGGPVLCICALVSFMGAIIALLGLSFFAPKLAQIAITFGPFEYLALMILSLSCAVGLASDSVVRGVGAAFAGLVIAVVGYDPSENIFRMTFGSSSLLSGFDSIPIVVGLFGVAEVLCGIEKETKMITEKIGSLIPSKKEMKLGMPAGLRGSFIGALLGLLPGMTASVASFLGYAVEKRVAKEKHLYGKGMLEGVASSEAANNACAVSGFVPLMALGIPTGPIMAMVLAALLMQGVVPGPLMFSTNQALAGTIIGSFFIGNIILVILNLPLVGMWVRIATIPYRIMAPVILFLCAVGSYSIRNSMFDLWVMLLFGVIGYIAKKVNFGVAPMILGLILGTQLEFYFKQASVLGFGALSNRPLAICVFIVAGIVLAAFTVLKGRNAAFGEDD